ALNGIGGAAGFSDVDGEAAGAFKGRAIPGNTRRAGAAGQNGGGCSHSKPGQYAAARGRNGGSRANGREKESHHRAHGHQSSLTPKRSSVLSSTSLPGSCSMPFFQMSRASR